MSTFEGFVECPDENDTKKLCNDVPTVVNEEWPSILKVESVISSFVSLKFRNSFVFSFSDFAK
jgi:hypothetical protein